MATRWVFFSRISVCLAHNEEKNGSYNLNLQELASKYQNFGNFVDFQILPVIFSAKKKTPPISFLEFTSLLNILSSQRNISPSISCSLNMTWLFVAGVYHFSARQGWMCSVGTLSGVWITTWSTSHPFKQQIQCSSQDLLTQEVEANELANGAKSSTSGRW